MNKITKKQSAEAKKELPKLFEQYGIVPHRFENSKFSHYPYVMKTKAGYLFLQPELEAGHACFSIFCIFDDVQEANKIIPASNTRLNRWSGKFNFHEGSVPYLLNQFKLEMNPIAVKSNGNVQALFNEAKDSMNNAEELGSGLSIDEYIELMGLISDEALSRKKTAIENKKSVS